jgi:CubicO group peptidase (beta-lactamase class C family)
MKKMLCGLLLFSALFSQAQNKTAQFDSLFRSLQKDKGFNGNVLIAENGKIIYQACLGYANLSTKDTLKPNTVFELASLSKQFTAYAIMLLQRDGKLQYDDSLRMYFPELPFPGVTIRHLLNHTSGLPDYMDIFSRNWDTSKIATNKDVIQIFAALKPPALFAPGEKYDYSNTGYAFLGSIIEKASGQSYSEYLRNHIFQPLGMQQTQVLRRRYEKRTLPNYAYGYVQNDAGAYVLPDSIGEYHSMVYCLDGIVGDGTVNSTIEDLWIWDRALHDYKLLSAEQFAPALKAPALPNKRKSKYGFGWFADSTVIYGRLMNHSGGWPGYNTFIERHTTNDKLFIVLKNVESADLPTNVIRNILYGLKTAETIKQPTSFITLPADSLKLYEGKYQLAADFYIQVFAEGNKLKGQASGQPSFELKAEKADTFYVTEASARIVFQRNEQGAVYKLMLYQNGQEVPGTKVKD